MVDKEEEKDKEEEDQEQAVIPNEVRTTILDHVWIHDTTKSEWREKLNINLIVYMML